MKHIIENLRALILIGLVISATACRDLSAIRKFAEVATVANQKFPALAKDLKGSCLRQRALQINRDNLRTPENLAERLAALLNENSNGQEPRCGLFAQQEEPLIQANKVLVNYLQTMGELAADDLTSYSNALNGLGDAFIGVDFNEAEVTAVRGLAGLVLKAATEGYRRKTLGSVITKHDAQVATLTAKLKDIVTRKYVLQLTNENDELDNYYITAIKDYEKFASPSTARLTTVSTNQPLLNPLPVVHTINTWVDERAKLQMKKEAALAYGEILDNIAKGHKALADGGGKLDDRKTLLAALGYAKTIFSLIDDFRAAF
jgi:hypothetical protein